MLRSTVMLVLLTLVLGVPTALAQSKKSTAPARLPTDKDPSVSVIVYLRDNAKNEVLLATRIWPDNPDYNAVALQRFFAMMKMLEPPYKKDDEVAYSWGQKGKMSKCSIYLESPDAGTKSGTGAVVGCEPNGVSSVPVMSVADPKRPSGSQDPKHLADVLELFKKQSERAKGSAAK